MSSGVNLCPIRPHTITWPRPPNWSNTYRESWTTQVKVSYSHLLSMEVQASPPLSERRILQAVQQSGVPALPTHQPAAASAPLMKIANWDGKSRIDQALIAAFEAMDYLDCIKNLRARQIEPQLYINSLGGVSPYLIRNTALGSQRIGHRSSTAFQPTQDYDDDAYVH